jgi:hypothetical protein
MHITKFYCCKKELNKTAEDYYLKSCIAGYDSKITFSGRNLAFWRMTVNHDSR